MPLPVVKKFFNSAKMPGAATLAAGSPLLRVTFIAGLILFFLAASALLFVSIKAGSAPGVSDGDFRLSLREYDRRFADLGGSGSRAEGELDSLNRELERMEKKAESVDALLSVLKRRRALARREPRYLPDYRQAALRAGDAYPHSDTLAALAAAALVQDAAITAETEAALRTYLPVLSDARLQTARLCLHALLGDMRTPERALDRLDGDFMPAALPYSFPQREAALIDAALLRIIRAESASGEITMLLTEYGNDAAPSDTILELAAEYFYDFDDPLRAAELFSRVSGDAALMRQADALWLADYPDSARNIWSMMADAPEGGARALYNLAFSADSAQDAMPLYQKLIALPAAQAGPYREAGLVRYSRYFDAPQAAALLAAEIPAAGGAQAALPELELLRRQTEMWESGRSIGALWLLVDRYPENENVYEWGAWYFNLQRAYAETAVLLKNGARRQFEGRWMPLHEALAAIGEGDLDTAENILTETAAGENSWEAAANLGRIAEARRAPSRALSFYEQAAALVGNPETASRIQLRIAHCLTTLGRPLESRRVLEYALDLNPDNINARLELGRLEERSPRSVENY